MVSLCSHPNTGFIRCVQIEARLRKLFLSRAFNQYAFSVMNAACYQTSSDFFERGFF